MCISILASPIEMNHQTSQWVFLFLKSHKAVMDPRDRADIGDGVVVDDADAVEWQTMLERALRRKLNFKLNTGDFILTLFNRLPKDQAPATRNNSAAYNYVGSILNENMFDKSIHRERSERDGSLACSRGSSVGQAS